LVLVERPLLLLRVLLLLLALALAFSLSLSFSSSAATDRDRLRVERRSPCRSSLSDGMAGCALVCGCIVGGCGWRVWV